MSNITSTTLDTETISQVILHGDVARLSPAEKLSYYNHVCDSLGLNKLTKPFAFIKLNGKEVLYALRDCTDQLRKVHKVSIAITAREHINGVYVVTAQASLPDGRRDESTGAVATERLTGEALANAFLKCETKAKRRVTLSICGLGLLDETEIESIKEATSVTGESFPKVQRDEVKAQSTHSQAKKETKAKDPRDHIIGGGIARGVTLWNLIKEKGDLGVDEYIKKVEFLMAEQKKSVPVWLRDMKINLELLRKTNEEAPVFEDQFDSVPINEAEEAYIEALINDQKLNVRPIISDVDMHGVKRS